MDDATRQTDEVGGYYYNGRATIGAKVRLARQLGLGGVMIWEVGQDCRLAPVTHRAETLDRGGVYV